MRGKYERGKSHDTQEKHMTERSTVDRREATHATLSEQVCEGDRESDRDELGGR